MPEPFYAWHVGDLVDGHLTAELPVRETSWQTVMDDAGPLKVVAMLGDPGVAGLNLYTSAEPARCFLAVAYTDAQGTETFLDAGPIWLHSYDSDTRALTISGAGLWSYYDHRKVVPVLANPTTVAQVATSFTGDSLGMIAKQLVALAHTHTGGAMPVVLPADESGTAARTYNGFDLPDLGAALRDLAAVDGGPEIQFVPRRKASDPTYLEWVMRVGTTPAPLLTQDGADWILDTTVERSPVTKITAVRDGSAMADRFWAQGAGTDISTLFARSDDTARITAGFPLLEAVDANRSDVADQATLSTYAAGGLKRSERPVETWTLTVNRDAAPNVAQYQVGDWVQITTDGDPYLPDGTYRARVTSKSGDDSTAVQVQLMPTVGV